MSHHDPRIDAYMERSAEFARPILRHLREVVHAACPEVQEGDAKQDAMGQLGRITALKDLPSKKKNRKAKLIFDAFPPSHRREYAEWVAEAKRAETRVRRAAQAAEWIAEGKQRNWKHEAKRT